MFHKFKNKNAGSKSWIRVGGTIHISPLKFEAEYFKCCNYDSIYPAESMGVNKALDFIVYNKKTSHVLSYYNLNIHKELIITDLLRKKLQKMKDQSIIGMGQRVFRNRGQRNSRRTIKRYNRGRYKTNHFFSKIQLLI